MKSSPNHQPLLWPAIALLLGFALSLGAAFEAQKRVRAEARQQFDLQVDRLERDVLARFEQPVGGLRSMTGFYAVNPKATRQNFRDYWEARDIAKEYPGVRGYGFIQRVKREELESFVQAERADGEPSFSVKTQGQADELFIIKLIEPIFNNRPALGLDVGSERVRNAGIQKAIQTGEPTLTGVITLLQDETKTPGFLYLLPLFRSGTAPETEAQRKSALLGFTYMPLVAKELLAQSAFQTQGLTDFELYDGIQPTRDNLVFFNNPLSEKTLLSQGLPIQPSKSRKLETDRVLDIGGRSLTLHASSTPAFEALTDSTLPALIGSGGAVLTLFVAMTLGLVSKRRAEAEERVDAMTGEMARLAKVSESTTNLVMIADARDRLVWVNDAFSATTGIGREQALQKTANELLEFEQYTEPEVLSKLRHAMAQRTSVRLPIQGISRDGRPYWLDVDLQFTRDSNGTSTGYVALAADITAAHLAEVQLQKALRETDALMRTVNTHAIVSETDSQGRITHVNQAFIDISGYSREELLGSNHNIVNSGAQDTSFWANMWQTISEGKSWRAQVCNRAKDGTLYWVESLVAPITSATGDIEKFVSIRIDVTAAKKAELALGEATLQLQSVLNAATEVAIIATTRKRKIILFNAGAQNLLGYAPEEVIGLHTRALFHDPLEMAERAAALSEEFGRPIEGVGVFIQEPTLGKAQYWTCIRKDGSRFDASEVFTAMYAPDGELLGYLSLTQDISQQKAYEISLQEARERAEQATQAKGQFLANMSHEIRTPMNAILGMLQLIQKTPLTSPQADYTGKAERAAKSLLSLINDILDFSKVDAGKMTLDTQPFRLDRLMRDLSVIVAANVGQKPVEVLFDIDPALPEVLLGDAMRLQQVLINLAGNAIKFTEKGEVVVGLRRVGELIHFSVKDSGIGIAPENQARIFGGFSQAEASTTRRFGGTGLGLSISKRLVELMGGTLQLQSTLGEGSTFSFSLPLPWVHDIPEALKSLPHEHTESLHVLVVDDNAVARDLMLIMLRSLGWQPEAAASGEEALRSIEQRHNGVEPQFQVIFIDWQMQGMDGWETARRIRKLGQPVGVGAPLLLMVTGHSREMLSQRTEREQSLLNGFLVKPVTASLLFDAVMDAGNPESTQSPSVKVASSERRLEGMRLLVVEDNLINQQVAEELLASEGARVSLAANGQIGVEAVAAAQPQFDAVLMDLQMPVLDGFGATRKIRDGLKLTGLPIIAMTANALDSDRADCLAAGMNDHVGKPFDLSHLVRTLLKHTGFVAQNTDEIRASPKLIADDPISARVLGTFQSDALDIAAALDRMGGDSTLYLKVLQSFVRDIATSAEQLAAHLAASAPQEALRQMHTLKGLASTVGANHLSAFARKAESQLKQGTPYPSDAANQLIAETREAVNAATLAITAVIQAGKSEQSPGPTPENQSALALDIAQAQFQLSELLTLLKQSDMEALIAFSRFQKAHGAALPKASLATVAELAQAMEAFEFADAALQCDTLIHQLRT